MCGTLSYINIITYAYYLSSVHSYIYKAYTDTDGKLKD